MMDLTIREIDAYARGVDKARRGEMAVALWSAWSAAGFNAYVYAGKRLPNLDDRLQKIMQPGGRRSSEITNVVFKMNEIAKRRGLPPPKPRQVKE